MLVGLSDNGDRVIARDATRDLHYFCPACSESLILKKGDIKIHHFAHKPDSTCLYAGETLEHLITKLQIYDALQMYSRVKNTQLEMNIGNIRPDIMFETTRDSITYQVGIEVQNSPIEKSEIQRRTAEYSNLDIAVIWLLPNNLIPAKKLNHGILECATTSWHRDLHALCEDKIYFYVEHLSIYPMHFYDIKREYSDKFIEEHPYIEQGIELKRTKGIKTYWKNLHLLNDFHPKIVNGNLLWADEMGLWWNTREGK